MDPSVIYEDGLYWRFTTLDNISIATAPSLEGPWQYKGALLHEGTSIYVVENQEIWVGSSLSGAVVHLIDSFDHRHPA